MFDLRDYEGAIREAVKRESREDPNWKWTVKAINKREVRIGWGYLDYLGEGDVPFTMTLDVDPQIHKDGECWITGYMQDKRVLEPLFFTVGKSRWDDTDNVETAITSCIHAIARRAHNTY